MHRRRRRGRRIVPRPRIRELQRKVVPLVLVVRARERAVRGEVVRRFRCALLAALPLVAPAQVPLTAATEPAPAPVSTTLIDILGHDPDYSKLVRLLQRFSRFELVPEAIPEGARPPPQWKEGKGRQRIEQVWPSTAFTAFVKVSVLSAFLLLLLRIAIARTV